MPQIINTNIPSISAQRYLNSSQGALNTALQRLSSGLRINSAKDDAAGLAISERMTSQIRGMNQAARNANDGISLAQTAEGALVEVTNNLQRIRELAIQSANGTNSASDRAALQSEVSQLTAEINRVATQTEFNGLKLMDGSFIEQIFQVGANANQTINISKIIDCRTSALGGHTLTADGTITGDIVTAASGAVNNGITAVVATDNFTLTTDAGITSPITYGANAGADAIASAINSAASGIGVSAKATNSTTLSGLSASGTVSFTLNGQAISAVVNDQNDLGSLVSAINGSAGTTGVTATFTSSSAKNSITLSTTDGRNINLQDFNTAAGSNSIIFGGTTLTEGTTVSAVKTGIISLTSSKGAISTANASAQVFAVAGVNNSSFTSAAAVDISSASGAQSALATIDAALAQVNSGRADLGAYQNRFNSTIANLETMVENLSASLSRIKDADFAKETASLTRGQILQQAGVAMLAQANAIPNNVLSLLR